MQGSIYLNRIITHRPVIETDSTYYARIADGAGNSLRDFGTPKPAFLRVHDRMAPFIRFGRGIQTFGAKGVSYIKSFISSKGTTPQLLPEIPNFDIVKLSTIAAFLALVNHSGIYHSPHHKMLAVESVLTGAYQTIDGGLNGQLVLPWEGPGYFDNFWSSDYRWGGSFHRDPKLGHVIITGPTR